MARSFDSLGYRHLQAALRAVNRVGSVAALVAGAAAPLAASFVAMRAVRALDECPITDEGWGGTDSSL